jgi:predicted transglutaminase-like cysteine proteinase
MSEILDISCDEAGHTGPDLLQKDQRMFAFSSVAISDGEAFEIIRKARENHPVQMPELKASRLLASERGRRLVADLLAAIDGRYVVSVNDKLLALCGWFFEYIYEPVYQDNPRLLYEKNFHRFVAMYTWLWMTDPSSQAKEAIEQFQKIGWVEFCASNPGECATIPSAPRDVVLTPQAFKDLASVNRYVNESVKPLSDLDHWGIIEKWSYPDDGYGDCEDYVLFKRRLLIQAGWPREALLITVVRDRKDEGHAVLTVKTDRGELILDNQAEHVLPWFETGYRFVKRQSQTDPNVWVLLGDRCLVVRSDSGSKT